MKQPITLTPAAHGYIKGQLASFNRGQPGKGGFRLSLSGKGCGDGKYVAELAAAARPGDLVVESGQGEDSVTLFVDMKATLRLFGTELDYRETPFESGLVFNNPNETGRCGCGESPLFDKGVVPAPQ